MVSSEYILIYPFESKEKAFDVANNIDGSLVWASGKAYPVDNIPAEILPVASFCKDKDRIQQLEQDKVDLELAVHTTLANLNDEISVLKKDKVEIERKYQELIMAVESKFMGESRHETALRYIKKAEAYNPESAGIARMEGK